MPSRWSVFPQGLKINHAKDNPAGMAISNKMHAQISGLDRASGNASDGISALHIADGALGEITDILQRMRELSVQAANSGTMSLEDKQAVQDEIEALKKEVDRHPPPTRSTIQRHCWTARSTQEFTERTQAVCRFPIM